MDLFTKMDNSPFWQAVERKSTRGGKEISAWFNRPAKLFLFKKDFWVSILQALIILVTAVLWVPTTIIGAIAEWREDRRDGIQSVRD